jgi:DHA1 family tetracycline resistance protein-like MFS transporter
MTDNASAQVPGYYALIAAAAADSVATGVILPALPFIALKLGSGAFGIGFLIAAASIASLIGQPLWGALADRFGTRRLLMIAPLVSASGQVIFAFSHNVPTLLAGRIVAGFGSAVVLLVQTHISKLAPPANRTALLGRVTAAQGVGTILGPALGGLLVGYGVRPLGFAAAAGPISCVILVATMVPAVRTAVSAAGPKVRRLASAITALRSPTLRPLALAILIGWFAFMGYAAVLPVSLQHRLHISSSTYAYVVSISGVVALVVRGALLGPLVRRFGEPKLMATGGSLIASSMVLAVIVPSVWFTPLLPLTWALGASLLFPCLVGEFSKAAPSGSVGLVLGAGALLSGTGIVLGPLAAGAQEQYLPGPTAFLSGAALLVIVVLMVGRRRPVALAPAAVPASPPILTPELDDTPELSREVPTSAPQPDRSR